MRPWTMSRWGMAAGVALAVWVGAAAPVRAQGTDPGDLAFWQSIQGSTDPAEYRAYLQAFPSGTFVPLARARIARLAAGDGGAPAPQPGMVGRIAPPAPAPEPEPVATVDEKIVVSPQPGRVGEMLKFTCVNFPKPYYVDLVVVVRAGSPDVNPLTNRDDMKLLARGYPSMCREAGYVEMGPFAPGRYEVRYVTGLYNDDHALEIRTRTPFVVR